MKGKTSSSHSHVFSLRLILPGQSLGLEVDHCRNLQRRRQECLLKVEVDPCHDLQGMKWE